MAEENTQTEKQNKKQNYDWLKPYHFKKGQSGNPNGRPKGKSLKTWVREYFESLTDEEKMEFLNNVDPKVAWEMAEGKPETKTDITSGGERIVVMPSEVISRLDGTSSETEGGSQ